MYDLNQISTLLADPVSTPVVSTTPTSATNEQHTTITNALSGALFCQHTYLPLCNYTYLSFMYDLVHTITLLAGPLSTPVVSTTPTSATNGHHTTITNALSGALFCQHTCIHTYFCVIIFISPSCTI